jgi:SAM-dependent methyltransferase
VTQIKQDEWRKQWEMFRGDDELFLFKEWIFPNTMEDFRGREVLECGCGGGQHTSFIAPYAKSVTAVDLNTSSIAAERNSRFDNIKFVEADIATMELNKKFDVVFSIGVVHHTDCPDKTITNLKKHLKPGGRLIIWVYSREGNFLARKVMEPVRKLFFSGMERANLLKLSKLITFLLYIPVYTIYFLPFSFLPYYEYFKNFRKLSFYRNNLNVFDKLNAPQVIFIEHSRVAKWFDQAEFDSVHISSYLNVSWRGSGTKNG